MRNAVYDILIHVFPGTMREVHVPQISTSYKADLGIRALKTLVEYKYAVEEKEAETVLRGFYEDVHGYASEDWKHFYAVLYMAEPFFTIQQMREEFKDLKVAPNWTPILVHGAGRREPKKAAVKKEED